MSHQPDEFEPPDAEDAPATLRRNRAIIGGSVIAAIVVIALAIFLNASLHIIDFTGTRSALIGTWKADNCLLATVCDATFYADGTAEIDKVGVHYTWVDDTHIKIDQSTPSEHHVSAAITVVKDVLQLDFGKGYTSYHRQ